MKYDASITPAERVEVEEWVSAHESAEITHVSVGSGAVVVHSADRPNARGKNAVAVRYPGGPLTRALDEALASALET